MANTYTSKLNLAKPAHGDVDWHIPINGNWDKLDSKLGPLYENITGDTTKLTVKKDIDMSSNDINNVGVLSAEKIKTSSYLWIADPSLLKPRYIDNRDRSSSATSWVTVKTTPPAKKGVFGSATIYYNFGRWHEDAIGRIRLLKNGVEVSGSEATINYSNPSVTKSVNVTIAENDVFELQIYSSRYVCGTSKFGIYAILIPIIDENESWF